MNNLVCSNNEKHRFPPGLASSTQVHFFVANLNFPLKKIDKEVLVEWRRKALSFQLNNIYTVAIQLESEAIISFNKKIVR